MKSPFHQQGTDDRPCLSTKGVDQIEEDPAGFIGPDFNVMADKSDAHIGWCICGRYEGTQEEVGGDEKTISLRADDKGA